MQSYPLSEPPPLMDLTYSFSLHQMVLPVVSNSREEVPCLLFGKRQDEGLPVVFGLCYFFVFFFQFSTPGFNCLSLLLNAAKGISRRRFREENMFQ